MNARLDDLDRQFRGLTGRLDNEFGATYENKVQKNLPSYVAQHLELRAPTVLKGPPHPPRPGPGRRRRKGGHARHHHLG